MEETEIIKTRKEREKAKRLAMKAQEQHDFEVAFLRRSELQAKDRDNAAMGAAIDDSGLRAKRIKELVAKTRNRYKWIAALTAQKKYKEKQNGREH